MAPPFLRTADAEFDGLADFPFEPHYLDIDGLRMHYIDEGPADAPVVLMMHGMPTWSYLYRHIIPPFLAAGFRCVAPDHIGFGKSDKVTDPDWYDIARHTANARELVTRLDLHRVTLMVQDWGGPTGLAQAAEMPERFERLVIMNTWLHHEGYEYTPAIRQWIAQWQPDGLFRSTIPDRFTLGGLMALATGRVTPQASIFKAARGEAPEYSPEAQAIRRAYDAPFAGLGDAGVTGPRRFPLSIPLHDPLAGNAEVQARHFIAINATALPVHFVWGMDDGVFDSAWGRRWAGLIPHATFDPIDGAAHFLQDTHGAQIAATVLDRIG
jgi:haloalkane dehalogenase